MSGKGSGRRPQKVTDEEAAASWARIFGNKTQTPKGEQPEPEQTEREQDDGE